MHDRRGAAPRALEERVLPPTDGGQPGRAPERGGGEPIDSPGTVIYPPFLAARPAA